jgi:hypothetical protein
MFARNKQDATPQAIAATFRAKTSNAVNRCTAGKVTAKRQSAACANVSGKTPRNNGLDRPGQCPGRPTIMTRANALPASPNVASRKNTR